MAAHKNEEIALKWFEAFNTHQLENLLALYADTARHFSPKLKIRRPETEGLVVEACFKGLVEGCIERLPSLQYVVTSLTANEQRVFMEYIRKVDGEEDMLVAEVLEISNGVIIASRVYHG